MPPKDKKKGVIKSSNKSPLFARPRRNPPRKVKTKSAYADVTENVNCSERKQNKTDCENAMIDPDCVWNDEKCITATEAGKPIRAMPLSGSNDTTGLYSSSDSLTSIGAPTPTATREEAQDDNMTQEEIKVDEERKAVELSNADISTVKDPDISTVKDPDISTATNAEEVSQVTPSPQEYTVSFEGTYDEEAKTFSGSLTIDGKTYTITSNPSMSSGVSSSSSPETDDNIAAIQKMLPTIPGITFNIQEV
jgi:hypothetical protein